MATLTKLEVPVKRWTKRELEDERLIDRLLANGFERGWISRSVLNTIRKHEKQAAKK
jgi:hypothetical protein